MAEIWKDNQDEKSLILILLHWESTFLSPKASFKNIVYLGLYLSIYFNVTVISFFFLIIFISKI